MEKIKRKARGGIIAVVAVIASTGVWYGVFASESSFMNARKYSINAVTEDNAPSNNSSYRNSEAGFFEKMVATSIMYPNDIGISAGPETKPDFLILFSVAAFLLVLAAMPGPYRTKSKEERNKPKEAVRNVRERNRTARRRGLPIADLANNCKYISPLTLR